MKINFDGIRNFLRNGHFFRKQEEGQHFLFDKQILARIADVSRLSPKDFVLEIGTGPATLTMYLANNAGFVLGIEKDERFRKLHEDIFKDVPNVKILYLDALNLTQERINEEINLANNTIEAGNKFTADKVKITGNIPYGITSPLITKILNDFLFSSVCFLIQKEVAERICSEPGTKKFGIMSVCCQYFTEPSVKFNVSPGSFSPPPKVDSSVIYMERKPKMPHETPEDRKKFFHMIDSMFQKRRKTILNSLPSVPQIPKSREEISEALVKNGFSINLRPEELSLEKMLNMYKILFNE